MSANLRNSAGSLLVVGVSGPELTALERAWLKLVQPAGVILFRRNIADAAQTRALLAEVTQFCTPHALRCIDVEGGAVDRLRDALAPMPSTQAVAQTAQKTDDHGLSRDHGELIARAVKAFGFNTTLAPVLDLGLPASAAVMGTRTAAVDPTSVIEYARNFLAGLSSLQVAGCGKHFPGLGGGMLDSHAQTPSIERSFRQIWNEDILPYRELHDRLPMIMVNHAAYPSTPSRNRPASIAPFWITKVLRKRIGYRGIIFSDDMEMGGILNFLPIEEAVVTAIRAGMDLVEICHRPELILRAYEAILCEAERSTVFRRLLHQRARESSRKRAKIFANQIPRALSARQFEALQNRIHRFRETIETSAAAGASAARLQATANSETA